MGDWELLLLRGLGMEAEEGDDTLQLDASRSLARSLSPYMQLVLRQASCSPSHVYTGAIDLMYRNVMTIPLLPTYVPVYEKGDLFLEYIQYIQHVCLPLSDKHQVNIHRMRATQLRFLAILSSEEFPVDTLFISHLRQRWRVGTYRRLIKSP